MRRIYFDIEISSSEPSAFEDCGDVSTFNQEETDLNLSECRAVDFEDLQERAVNFHENAGYQLMNGDWYCEKHAPLAEAKEAA